MSDDELADLVLSPNALRALREYLADPETEGGAWLIGKILEVESARPDAEQQARRAEQIYQSLRSAGLLATDEPPTTPNIARAQIIILVAHPIAMRKPHKGSRGAPEVRADLLTGDTIRPGGPESWKLTTKDSDPDIPLPPEVASRCYGTPSQRVTLTLHLVPVAGATGRFGPQLAVSPAPTLDALIFDVTFADGTEQTLTVPVPRGKRPIAYSQNYNPLPDTALGQDKWELTVSAR